MENTQVNLLSFAGGWYIATVSVLLSGLLGGSPSRWNQISDVSKEKDLSKSVLSQIHKRKYTPSQSQRCKWKRFHQCSTSEQITFTFTIIKSKLFFFTQLITLSITSRLFISVSTFSPPQSAHALFLKGPCSFFLLTLKQCFKHLNWLIK